MARATRPASESYQSVCSSVSESVSYSSGGGTDEDDQAPIFSLSKSSMDVVTVTGLPHKRDPAWTRMDLRRSCSTNTHPEQSAVTLQQQLQPRMWQHINAANSHQLSLTTQNVDIHNPPILSERWISNMQRWSECSGSTHSRSSTPDSVVWKGGSPRSCSVTQETPYSAAPNSPMSKLTSPPTTPSPLTSPLHTPTLPSADLLRSSSSLRLSTHQQEDLLESSPAPSPLRTRTSSSIRSNSPDLHQLTSIDDEGFLENNLLAVHFPSPVSSSVSLAEAGVSSDPGCLVDDVINKLPSEGARNPEQMFSYRTSTSAAEEQELSRGSPVCHLELPLQPQQSRATGRGSRSPLVSSLSDSRLGYCCRCREGIAKAPMVEVFRHEAATASQLKMVDAAVQTVSPSDSWSDLRRNITFNMGSPSILGSPPGSRLNLKTSVGSNSNLVSPSSSMFPGSSGEEQERQGDDLALDVNFASLHDLERRRSCLKSQTEETRNAMGRRSSMKQVQWDEDGMTWDIHGATVDPKELSTAIQKHMELKNSPEPLRPSLKKSKAPKPPVISNVVTAMMSEKTPPSVRMVEGEGTPDAESGREVHHEGGSTKEETVEVPRRRSRAEGDNAEEVYGEEGSSDPKSSSHGRRHSRKKGGIRSLRRPGWCGGSTTAED
ncbi:uncharacterized protein [Embiotoca jacksoni]|uniref:uncharacterized protein n=1 Tax=Embiotoca jacksoni TaxID=100190 RepID=UPI003704AD99